MGDPQPLSELVPPFVAALADRDLAEAYGGAMSEREIEQTEVVVEEPAKTTDTVAVDADAAPAGADGADAVTEKLEGDSPSE